MPTILVSKEIYDYLVSRGMGSGESASSVLRRELLRTVEVDDEMYAYILSRANEIGESASSILRRELNLTITPPPAARIEFRIKQGTGGEPWNTQAETVTGVVGQTLRIVNDDAVPHRLHTNGAPFPHPAADIAPGQLEDFLLRLPFDSANQPPIYDHGFGQSARFWISVRASD